MPRLGTLEFYCGSIMAELRLEHVSKMFGKTCAVADTSITIADGEFVVLVGPSGCGKTTLLRIIAGLEAPTTGQIYLGGTNVTKTGPAKRDLAMVFQDYALFPQMTVRGNLAFGLKVRKVPRPEIDGRIAEVAKALELAELLDRKPAQLSGGQRQRVAMGRAIIRQPKAFLMDEPLSNLDANLRVQMRAELASLRERLSTTTVYVTHDQVEAMTLADRVVVLSEGVVLQSDSPASLFEHPGNIFVAAFIGSPGMNLAKAVVKDNRLWFGSFKIPIPRRQQDRLNGLGSIIAGIRPTDFAVAGQDVIEDGCTFEVIPDVVERLGSEVRVLFPVSESLRPKTHTSTDELMSMARRFTACLRHDIGAKAGFPIKLAVRSADVHYFDPGSGDRIGRGDAGA